MRYSEARNEVLLGNVQVVRRGFVNATIGMMEKATAERTTYVT